VEIMKKDPQIKEENDKVENNEIKKGFFKKVWYSIDKIEKYSELSAEGFGRAIKYLGILIIIIAIISSVVTVYNTSLEVKKIAEYINEKSPELTYSDGTLQIDSPEVITDDSSNFGKIIIDTKTDSEEQINQYKEKVNEEENAIIILKDKLILKDIGTNGTSEYNYKELFKEVGITEFNKQQLVEYLKGSNMMPLYLNLFLVLFIYAFVIYFINTVFYIIAISVVGYLATLILKLKIRYVAVFNMAVYAITLPTVLNMLYLIVNAFYRYTISYFDVMYILVASIYMIAAIFLLKSEFNKKQGEVQKIVEVEKEVKEEMKEKQEEKKEEKQENKDTKKKNKKEKTKDDNENGQEPEGSNA
jgi:erythrocyte binding protein, putative